MNRKAIIFGLKGYRLTKSEKMLFKKFKPEEFRPGLNIQDDDASSSNNNDKSSSLESSIIEKIQKLNVYQEHKI